MSNLQPVIDRGVAVIHQIEQMWPPVDTLVPSESNVNNPNTRRSNVKREQFMAELDKYRRFLLGFPDVLKAELEKNATQNPITILGTYRSTCEFGKPLDPQKFERSGFDVSIILGMISADFLEELVELLKLYYELERKEPKQFYEQTVLDEIKYALAYFEYSFPNNQPCLNFFINKHHDILERAKAILAAGPVRRTEAVGDQNPEILERLLQNVRGKSNNHSKIQGAYITFKIYLCQRYNGTAIEHYTSREFEEFLNTYNFFLNQNLQTTGIPNFNEALKLLREILAVSTNEEIFTPDYFSFDCDTFTNINTGGGRRRRVKTQKSRRLRRKQRKSRKN